MSIVTITLNNKNFQLLCNDGSENQLIELATKLDEKITEIKTANPASSFELLLVMSALSLQDQTQNLNNKLDKINGSKNNEEDEKFAETLSAIALYLENLAQKIGK
jgi:cell division protein ZapA (FtsZ GTPase activity inhibitor)